MRLVLCCVLLLSSLSTSAFAQAQKDSSPGVLKRAESWLNDRLAGETAEQWLEKIGPALRHQNYQGVLVYVSGNNMRTMAIFHAYENGQERERIVALSGGHREIVRDDKRVMLVGAKTSAAAFDAVSSSGANPTEMFANLADAPNYSAKLGGSERVAGRLSKIIELSAKDEFRYGYRLWLDKETGLPLRAALIDEKERTLEQIAFTEIQIGKPLREQDLQASQKGQWKRIQNLDVGGGKDPGWRVLNPPKGFEFRAARQVGNAVQLLYSDGLAAISIHVEPSNTATVGESASRRGAINAHTLVYNGVRIVAIGKVPMQTVQKFAVGVRPPGDLK